MESVRENASHALRRPSTQGYRRSPTSTGSTTRRLQSASPGTRVVVLTSYHDDEHIFPALRAGASSFLLKDIGPSELAHAVRRTAAGEAMLDPRIAARVVRDSYGPAASTPDPLRELTPRELEVLRLLGEALSSHEIAERLTIGGKTVKTHVSAILSKLGRSDRTQAAVLAWREGVVRDS